MYTVRRKTIWLATPKAFYRKNYNMGEITVPVYEFRTWRIPINLAWSLMRAGYAMNEETAAAWALDHKPKGAILRGVSRESIHTFSNDSTMEDVLNYTKATLIRQEVENLSTEAMAEPLSERKSKGGCREFEAYAIWVNAAMLATH